MIHKNRKYEDLFCLSYLTTVKSCTIVHIKRLQRSNLKLVTSCGSQLSAHLLSLHNRADVADSRGALTRCRLKYKSTSKNLAFIYLLLWK